MADLQAVLFDLDDTLIDWSGFNKDYKALEETRFSPVYDYVVAAGVELPHIDELLLNFRDRAMAGWEHGRETMVAPIMPDLMLDVFRHFGVLEEMLDRDKLLSIYKWGAVPGTTVFPEVPGVLQTLLDAKIKIGIVTNAMQPMLLRDRELEEHGLLRYFETCRFAAADIGYLKPHPVVFETAIACTGTAPASTVFVGDSLNADIAGANRVGLKTVWRDTGYHSSRESRDIIHPDATITDLAQLLDHLDNWYPGWRTA
jgi:FMN phosphatase YigB (HAD superfamily)